MKKTLFLTLALLGLAGCQQATPTQPSGPTTAKGEAQSVGGPVQFEIRDFALDKDSESYGVTYRGHGTLVTHDPRLAHGTFIVWISVKQGHENDEELKDLVLVRDGLGTIKTNTFQTSDEEKTEKVRFYDWSIVGYSALQPGVMKTSGSPAES